MSSPTFIENAVAGSLAGEDMDDFIDQWHASPGGLELFEYLGMTEDEYDVWLRDPRFLEFIVQARAEAPGRTDRLDAILNVAQRDDSEDAQRLVAWLREAGLVAV